MPIQLGFLIRFTLIAFSILIHPGYTQPTINTFTANTSHIKQYNKFELSLKITASYTNPFDMSQVHLQADFIAPSGLSYTVDGFYFQDFQSPYAMPVPQGKPGWKIRFAPTETGTWHYTLRLQDTTGGSGNLHGTFVCDPPHEPGFIRRANTHFLRFDDGHQYFALGENMAWGDSSDPLADFERWMAALATNGGNYIRTWMPSWGFAIEWRDTGLGNYRPRQHRAFQLDWLIEKARQNGIYIQLVLNNHGQLSTQINPEWHDNPYNAVNGGPCLQPWEFFTLPQAKDLFKRRLRYIIARWGYATTIMAWEFFNEVDLIDDYAAHKGEIKAWHIEMANFLKMLDPNKHLLTTSFSGSNGHYNEPALWDIEHIDFSQIHYYSQASDPQRAQINLTQDYLARFGKPTLIGEFCFSNASQARTFDPTGIYLHNTLWATAFSGSLGAAAIWWWDNYIHPLNLYYHFSPLQRFFSTIDLIDGAFHPITVQAQTPESEDLTITPALGFEHAPEQHFAVLSEGTLNPSTTSLSSYLFGASWNTDKRNPPTFTVAYPQNGLFHVVTGATSGQNPILVIHLNGIQVFRQEAQINTVYSIDITAGTHQIQVDNQGTDWIEIAEYKFSNYVSGIRSFALEGNNQTIGWVQNRKYNWHSVRDVGIPTPIRAALLYLDVPAGKLSYTVNWWDTTTGTHISSDQTTSSNGRLRLNIPPLQWDIAYKITPNRSTSIAMPTILPATATLAQNFPNPFNHATTIRYQISTPTRVHLVIFDSLGRQIRTLIAADQQVGLYHQVWDGRDNLGQIVGSGIYFCHLEIQDQQSLTKPMVLMK